MKEGDKVEAETLKEIGDSGVGKWRRGMPREIDRGIENMNVVREIGRASCRERV